MSDAQIIGICLVRNEERYLDRVIANSIEFCDRFYIADNESTDQTPALAAAWAERDTRVVYRRIRHPAESHALIEQYANSPTWIFAVDGDEIYDPAGLKILRDQVRAGRWDAQWMIIGNALNCVFLDLPHGVARGYLSPPSRSITKLYNFNAITCWSEVTSERLHGGRLLFKDGFNDRKRENMNQGCAWEESIFRCLHLCFLPRSRLDKIRNGRVSRWNIAEQQSRGYLFWKLARLLGRFNIIPVSKWKWDRYARGPEVKMNVRDFFV